ncbi:gamma-glutamyltransferase [Altererythrobacter arenosus]|uniref:Glutathione hydrolase proenzyme n=1 Tax=Altererythrobacter arenosus TaxID=3032592 RepID=A0ABY8FZ01_9SPHN|nr:gamma-glutamyltransferase [Altererythrobacter sp. CAU 1644]WFL78616.1 gamma-glutamyltransferase [Altererythrobacter sp. CAU 1644]
MKLLPVSRLVFAPLLAGLSLAGCASYQAVPQEVVLQGADQLFYGGNGAVTAADPRAEAAGQAMLDAGGSATDAAIAVMLALTVVEPQSSGIGGGGFLVRGTKDGAVTTFDGRETAPAGATPDWFLKSDGTLPSFDESVQSGLSVGVPGNVRLAEKAHASHGRLPWAKLFEPAITFAREGFEINPRLHNYLKNEPGHAGFSDAAKALYYDAEGQALPVGALVRNEELAQTFERIAREGAAGFYDSTIGSDLVATVAAATPRDGAMTLADVSGYRAKQREAVCGSYRAYRICSMGPPTSGGIAVLQILGQLERFDLKALGRDNPVTWHLFLESQRLAYADREIYLADADFVSVPVAGLLDREYLASRSALIDPASRGDAKPGQPAGAPQALADGDEPPESGTSHFAVVDASGTMVSYTSTIEGAFGSGLMSGGFYLNNELTDFSRSPTVDGKLVANRVEGGKRPRSSMSPTVIWDPQGRPFMAVGAAGGPTIPVTTTRAIIGAIDFGLGAEEALDLPFAMAFRGAIMLEKGTWMEQQADAFRALGHTEIVFREAPIKGNAITRGQGGWESARDPRIERSLAVP